MLISCYVWSLFFFSKALFFLSFSYFFFALFFFFSKPWFLFLRSSCFLLGLCLFCFSIIKFCSGLSAVLTLRRYVVWRWYNRLQYDSENGCCYKNVHSIATIATALHHMARVLLPLPWVEVYLLSREYTPMAWVGYVIAVDVRWRRVLYSMTQPRHRNRLKKTQRPKRTED